MSRSSQVQVMHSPPFSSLPVALAAEFGAVRSDCELSEEGEISPRPDPAADLSSHISLVSHPEEQNEAPAVPIRIGRGYALAILRALHAEHAERLRQGGIPGPARVLLADWRRAIHADPVEFAAVVADLEGAGYVERLHGYARHVANRKESPR